jgi:Tfp pilus assembly protein PilO
MDTEALGTWISALKNLRDLQNAGVKVRAAVEKLREQAPNDLEVRSLIGQIVSAEEDSPWAMCPP